MNDSAEPVRHFDKRLIDGLYMDAIVLADEARFFFDQQGETQRIELSELERVDFACESLKVTTRIMHVIAWLLTQRAISYGELSEAVRLEEKHRLGAAARTTTMLRETFKADMAMLIIASEDLYDRTARLEQQLLDRASQGDMVPLSPARDLLNRLERSL
jgi:regulator of CtrA degradation